MDKEDVLKEIFENDPLGLLNAKAKSSNAKTTDQRLIESFEEINAFIEKEGKEPEPNMSNVVEYRLYSRLKGLRDDKEKKEALAEYDHNSLLDVEEKVFESLDDILGDDTINLLDTDSDDLYNFKHTPKEIERADSDFVARRKPCKDFDQFEPVLKKIQTELSNGKRRLVKFKEDNLRKGAFYVHNGLLFQLAEINITKEEKYHSDGSRTRKDGRTRCVFENGTESNMLYRSVAKILYQNGQVVTENFEEVNKDYAKRFAGFTEDDTETGHIYALKSKSNNPEISAIKDLYKIGYSSTTVEDRIKNAANEPTYLMADVEVIGEWQVANVPTQKFELLLHTFFGVSCLDLEVKYNNGKIHRPREWFIAPIDVIRDAISLLVSEQIVNYRYDSEEKAIVLR